MLGEKGRRVQAGLGSRGRLVHDKGVRVRVGDDLSPVVPGDAAPGGGTYRSGQYAPTIDDLAIATFSAAKFAGIMPADLPIFDDNGDIDKDKLDAWSPGQEGLAVNFSPDVPNYSSAVVVSSLKQVNENILNGLNLSVLMAPRTPGYFGNYIIAARTSSENRVFSSGIYVYPDFYRFIDKPIIPKTPKRSSGVSISSFMVLHATGHVFLSKLTFNGKIADVAAFLESSGWSKNKKSDGLAKASFMQRDSTSAWFYSDNNRFLTELSRYSPLDDFAQAFAIYHTNAEYLQRVDPKKYEIMNKLVSEFVA